MKGAPGRPCRSPAHRGQPRAQAASAAVLSRPGLTGGPGYESSLPPTMGARGPVRPIVPRSAPHRLLLEDGGRPPQFAIIGNKGCAVCGDSIGPRIFRTSPNPMMSLVFSVAVSGESAKNEFAQGLIRGALIYGSWRKREPSKARVFLLFFDVADYVGAVGVASSCLPPGSFGVMTMRSPCTSMRAMSWST